jgi:hypothetical protein
MADARPGRGFAPTVALGLVTGALSAVASAKPWFRLASDSPVRIGIPPQQSAVDMPLALALSLVVLAGWGALLVARGRLRRLFALLALAAALGVVACVASAPFLLPDDLRSTIGPTAEGAGVQPTGWLVTAAVVALPSALSLAVAWRRAPGWPTMSSRYDAPAGPSTAPSAPAPVDLWKALDQGHDPTDPRDPDGPASP